MLPVDYDCAIVVPAFIVFSVLSASLIVLARSPWGARRARSMSLLALLLAAAATWFDMTVASSFSAAEKFVLGDATGILLVAVVLVPALPLQMLALGLYASHRSHRDLMRAHRHPEEPAQHRHEAPPPAEKQLAQDLEAQLHATSGDAVDRMEEIIGRRRRFTNLDRAEVREVDLADLLRDAVDAAPGPAQPKLSTAQSNSSVEITIWDNRPPISARQLAALFEPRFKVSKGRVVSANWTWFNARQIIREHEGEIQVASDATGTKTVISLPARSG